MPITINGSGTVTGLSAGGLPDASVTDDDLATSLDFSGHTVTGLPAGGKILKVQSTPMSVASSSYSSYSSYTDTGVTASFTPTDATSSVLVNLAMVTHCDASTSMTHVGFFYRLMRSINGGAYAEVEAWEEGAVIRAYTSSGTAQWAGPCLFSYLDSPNTTSAITYKIQVRNSSGGYSSWGTDKTHVWTFMEVAA